MGPDEEEVIDDQGELENQDDTSTDDDETSEDEESGSEEESPETDESGSSEDDVKEHGESNKKLKKRVFYTARENETLRRENEQLRLAAQPKEEDLVEPKRDDYESIDEYIAARDDYVEKVTERKTRTTIANEQQQETEDQEYNRLLGNWDEMKIDARDKYDDFDEVLTTSEVKVTGAMSRYMFESEYGAEIAYHMGKNPKITKLAQGIEKLSVTQQAAKMVRIEDMVKQELDKPSKNTSGAPTPTKPVKPGSSAESGPNEKDSTEDWMTKRRAQKAARRG